MSDNTPRLALPQLAQMQEMDAATINESLVQIDALSDIYLLGQYVNTPPASPTDGDTYITGGAPTGGWSGYAYKIAYCIDGGWRFYTPFNGLRAFLATANSYIVYVSGSWVAWDWLLDASEASVASATTTDIGAPGALAVAISGTATITGLGTGANLLRLVRFAGALTLTHNATSLVLLGGVSRAVAAGDTGLYRSDASGNWREITFFRAAADPGDYATCGGTQTLTHKTLAVPILTGAVVASGNGAASTPVLALSGALFTGGSGTTTVPFTLVQPSGAAAATSWNTGGTLAGLNAPSGFAGIDGSSRQWCGSFYGRERGAVEFRKQSCGRVILGHRLWQPQLHFVCGGRKSAPQQQYADRFRSAAIWRDHRQLSGDQTQWRGALDASGGR